MAKITINQESSDPAAAGAGIWQLYFKSGGLYARSSAGTVAGPFEDRVTLKTYFDTLYNPYPTGHLFGLALSNNGSDATNDIDIAAGNCRDITDAANIVLASALTKRLDAGWAVGTNQGGLDTGSIANATYHIWIIKRSDTGVVDALFSTSVTAPTMPANYDYKRLLGSVVRTGAAIKAFIQDGDMFRWLVPVKDIDATNPGTAAVTRTLTLPTGRRLEAILSVLGASAGVAADNPSGIFISDLSITDTAASTSASSIYSHSSGASTHWTGGLVRCMTNTSAQVRSRVEVSTASTKIIIQTHGWIDQRGRMA